MNATQPDPVLDWIKNNHCSCDLTHEIAFDLDGKTLTIRSNAEDLIKGAADAFRYYHRSAVGAEDADGIKIEIYCIGSHSEPDGLYPDHHWYGRLKQEGVPESDIISGYLYARRDDIDFFWRPYDIMISLSAFTSRPIRVLVGNPVKKETWLSRKKVLKLKGIPTFPKNLPGVMDLLKMLYIKHQQYTCLHAAAVAIHGKGIIITGPSGRGKTTTALTLARNGFTLLSDELTLIEGKQPAEMKISGLLIPPLLVGDPINSIEEIEQTLLSPQKEHKCSVRLPQEIVEKGRGLFVPPEAIFFLAHPENGDIRPKVEKISSNEAFVMLMQQGLDLNTSFCHEDRVDAILSIVERCAAYRLTLSRELNDLPGLIRAYMTP